MPACVEVEISLRRREAESYTVEFRCAQPGSDADTRLGGVAQFDFAQLRQLSLDPAAYGAALSSQLFAAADVRAAFAAALACAQDSALRVRLWVDADASELHALRWETLCDPDTRVPLFQGERAFLSRYLNSLDWRPVRLRAKGDLRALAAVANPANLGEYKLAPVEGELERARAALGNIPLTPVVAPTLPNILTALRETDYGIFYLVCHGKLDKEEPWLYLENEGGQVARISGTELVDQLRGLAYCPRLIVLVSCQSAGTDTAAPLLALGPRLAQAGAPAVLAMQGDFSMETAKQMLPVFFAELQKHGEIDRALGVARADAAAHRRPDWWMPALFTRLKSGRLWYTPGFGEGFERWPALLSNIRNKKCVPILGPGLLEPLLGPARELAAALAEKYQYPLSPHEREALTQVTQYLAVNQQDPELPANELAQLWREQLQSRCAAALPPELSAPNTPELSALLSAAAQAAPGTPHVFLASLPIPIYFTTTPDDLLVEALTAAGRPPHALICPWSKYVTETYYPEKPDCLPTPEKPLVYFLFGRWSDPRTLVITEDDYFDYLGGVARNNDLIPEKARAALAHSLLLFIGFQLEAWDMRIIFRSLLGQEGRDHRLAHIAAQVDPEDDRLLAPGRARKYLERFFHSKEAEFSIYWGNAAEFMRELERKWKP